MALDKSISVSTLDFDEIKNNLITFLRTQSSFKDYDFEGSNINVLLDVLAYNTFLNGFYLNMVTSEMFLDSAQLRDSVVSHSKDLNYVPRSFKSAQAIVDLTVTPPTGSNANNVVVPKGTSFTARVGSNNFSFTVNQNIILKSNDNGVTFKQSNLVLYEGGLLTDAYVYNTGNVYQRFLISNPLVDTDSLVVTSIEDAGSNTVLYSRATTLLDVGANSNIYFLQGAENSKYEIVFGDGILGRKPKDGSTIAVEYRVSSGELPNGASVFVPDGAIDGYPNVSISVIRPARGGAINESIDSIKFNAPRHYQTQERAVTAEDYETLLRSRFTEINTLSVYGGEELIPPQYGKVFIAVDLKDVDGITESKKDEFFNYIKPKTPVTIDPVFIDPEFLFVDVYAAIKYNVNTTRLAATDIEAFVVGEIEIYNNNNLKDFKSTLYYSKLLERINNAHPSIVSADLTLSVYKTIEPESNVTGGTYIINFELPIVRHAGAASAVHSESVPHGFYSSSFIFSGKVCRMEDDGQGNIRIVTLESGLHTAIGANIGVINYDTGVVNLTNFQPESYQGSAIKVYASTTEKDISSTKNVVLEIKNEDLNIDIIPVRA